MEHNIIQFPVVLQLLQVGTPIRIMGVHIMDYLQMILFYGVSQLFILTHHQIMDQHIISTNVSEILIPIGVPYPIMGRIFITILHLTVYLSVIVQLSVL
jgi:hypothetical protein